MAIISHGSMDGKAAKIVYHPERRQTHIYWGGMNGPDGIGHNHATIQDANPEAVHFMRVNGVIVTNQSFDSSKIHHRRQQAASDIVSIFRTSLDRALRWWGWR